MSHFLKIIFALIVLFSLPLAQAVVVQEGTYKIVSDICYDKKGQTAGACDPAWKTSLQEIRLVMGQGRSPFDGAIHVVPLKQRVPALDPTVPTGYFSNHSLAETEQTTYVYENVAWVSNRFVGESELGLFVFHFFGNQLEFSVFGASFEDHGALVRKIRTMTFEKQGAGPHFKRPSWVSSSFSWSEDLK